MSAVGYKTAFNARAKASMREFLRSKTWEEKVESIERMNEASKMARKAMIQMRLICEISTEEYSQLKQFLNTQARVGQVSSRWVALEMALDPHAAQGNQQMYLGLANPRDAAGGDTAKGYLTVLLTTWIRERNERKKAEIQEGKERSLVLICDSAVWTIKTEK